MDTVLEEVCAGYRSLPLPVLGWSCLLLLGWDWIDKTGQRGGNDGVTVVEVFDSVDDVGNFLKERSGIIIIIIVSYGSCILGCELVWFMIG